MGCCCGREAVAPASRNRGGRWLAALRQTMNFSLRERLVCQAPVLAASTTTTIPTMKTPIFVFGGVW